MEKVYNFSNENLAAFKELYDFKNARVLSVGGSGDQYFTAILNGAKEVTLFDSNPDFWPYFIVKFCALQNLSYDDFCELFIRKGASFSEMFSVVESYIPSKEKDKVASEKESIGFYYDKEEIKTLLEVFETKPYLVPESYKILQQNLRKIPLPDVYFVDIQSLRGKIGDRSYDIMLTSNIYDWVVGDLVLSGDNDIDYLNMLAEFNCPTIQAQYQIYMGSIVPSAAFSERCIVTPVKSCWKPVKYDFISRRVLIESCESTYYDYVYTYKK